MSEQSGTPPSASPADTDDEAGTSAPCESDAGAGSGLPDALSEALEQLQAEQGSSGGERARSDWPPDALAVLATVDTADQQRVTPMSVLCPGCGTVVRRYEQGLPRRLARFREDCPECGIELHRWCAAVIDTTRETFPTPAQLEGVVTSYWDQWLWSGVVSSPDEYPRNREYTRWVCEKADAFDWDWTVRCPLCRRSLDSLSGDQLDYHHWSADPDEGVCLCRACHDALTNGATDRKQDWTAQQAGFKNKHDLQFARLALREQVVAPHETVEQLGETLTGRYRVPVEPPVVVSILERVLLPEPDSEVVDVALLSELSL